MPTCRVLQLAVVLVPTLAACGGGNGPSPTPPTGDSPDPPPDTPPPTVDALHGRYVGQVTIDGITHFADAIFTPDGEARIYVGGAGDWGGAIPVTRPPSAHQFVGRITLEAQGATGDGVLVAEGCALTPHPPSCGEPANAALTIPGAVAGYESELQGSLSVATASGIEIWDLSLTPWDNVWRLPGFTAGQYVEQVAEFTADGDTLLTIDAAGTLFFQSPGSGCVGNGQMTADPDFNLLNVSLDVASCTGGFEYLNGEFAGIGTYSTSNYWAYDFVLRLWLARSGTSGSPAAFTMWSLPNFE